MADRRETLRIIGAIGTTCAFPYSADELYGQHVHQAPDTPAAGAGNPVFFTPREMETVTKLADLILPATDTPGAVAAGVPLYIDFVVSSNAKWQKLFRQGMRWLDRQSARRGKRFVELAEAQQVAMLKPLCDAADRAQAAKAKLPMEVSFFKAVKGMTADGFFTSKQGLVDTMGYSGNTVMAEFPPCIHEH